MPFVAGQHNFICDVCGFNYKSSEKRILWNGLVVCPADYETDHPQKYIRAFTDIQTVSIPRPDQAEEFPYVCYIYGKQAYADLGEADCMQADNQQFTYSQARQFKGV